MPGLLLAIIFLIVYGSLYPWQFHSFAGSPLPVLLNSTQLVLDRFIVRDIAVNVILYVPLGASACIVFRRSRFFWLFAVLLGTALSIVIELAQVYTPTRRPSLMDVVCNTCGAALGAVLVGFFELHKARPQSGAHPGGRAATALLLLGATFLLFPLFPALSQTALYQKLRVISHFPVMEAVTILSFATIWFAAGRLGLKAWPAARPWWLSATILLLPAQLFIVERQPRPAELIGALSGTAAFALWGRRNQTALWFAWAFFLVLLLRGLAPFRPGPVMQAFTWAPFGAALEMEWQPAVSILLQKVFWYFGAAWILHDAGVRWLMATMVTAGFLTAIEIAQMWLPGRSPEITDPLLAIMGGVVLWVLRTKTL